VFTSGSPGSLPSSDHRSRFNSLPRRHSVPCVSADTVAEYKPYAQSTYNPRSFLGSIHERKHIGRQYPLLLRKDSFALHAPTRRSPMDGLGGAARPPYSSLFLPEQRVSSSHLYRATSHRCRSLRTTHNATLGCLHTYRLRTGWGGWKTAGYRYGPLN